MGETVERLHALLERAGVGVNEIDARTGVFTRVSQRFCDLLGYTAEELIGREPASITHPDDAAREAAPVSELRAGTRDAWTTEKRYLRRDGTVMWARLHVSRDTTPGAYALLALVENVTDRCTADAALRDAEARSRALIDQAVNAMLMHDLEGRIVDVNRRACESLGYSRDELLALSVTDIEMDFDLTAAKEYWARLVPGDPILVQGHQRRKDGTTFPVDVRVGALDLAGRRLLLGLAHDVTERERAKADAARREGHMITVLHATPSGILVTRDVNRTIIDVNDAFVALFGWSREEVLGRTVAEIGLYSDANARAEALAEYSRTGIVTRKEVIARHRSGVARTCVLTAGSIEVGGERCAVACWEDITELRRTDAALRVQTSALQAAANGVVITDPRGVVEWVNDAFSRLTGYTAADVLGTTPRVLRSGMQSAAFYRDMWDTILDGRIWRGELINRRKDGSLYTEDMTITPVRHANGVIASFHRDQAGRHRKKGASRRARASRGTSSPGARRRGARHVGLRRRAGGAHARRTCTTALRAHRILAFARGDAREGSPRRPRVGAPDLQCGERAGRIVPRGERSSLRASIGRRALGFDPRASRVRRRRCRTQGPVLHRDEPGHHRGEERG